MYKINSLLFLTLLSNLCFADIVFIGGVKHTVTDFDSPNSSTRVAKIDVIGDDGQELIFDITAIVEGKGKIRSEVSCTPKIDSSDVLFQQCTLIDDPEINDFVFDVKMSATCYPYLNPKPSEIVIGSDRDNRNIYTNLPIYEQLKDVTLTINNEVVTGGSCEILDVVITSYLQDISDIHLEVIISSPF